MNKVIEVKHPLVTHKLSIMRNKKTSTSEFRQLSFEITSLLTFEATKHFEMESVKISTPVCDTQNQKCSGKKPAVISILRAGNGMLEGMLISYAFCSCWFCWIGKRRRNIRTTTILLQGSAKYE